MVPWLLIVELVIFLDVPISELVGEYIRQFPASGEINSKVNDPERLMARIESLYQSEAQSIDYTDGLSINFSEWRFNVRKSNTEPLVRLNVESKSNAELMRAKTKELLSLINSEPIEAT